MKTMDDSERAKLNHQKGKLMEEINFLNTVKSIYTEYPPCYSEIIDHSKNEIEAIMLNIKEMISENAG
jgi:hypothetical protein